MKTVIKIGTSTLTHAGGWLNIKRTEELCKVISDLKNAGEKIILVTSGAVGLGTAELSLPERPKDMATKQAAAAVGQSQLMNFYGKMFSEYNHVVAQILITAADINHEDRRQNFMTTLNRLLELNVIPIINENDTVAVEEMGIGDNDTLASVVAANERADLLILLSDIDGLYTGDPHKDPNAKMIHEVTELSEEIMALGGESVSGLGTGGMRTKLNAAKRCMDAGCDMIIANGANPSLLYDIFEGKQVGTRFSAKKGE